jgi:hypothetical protein
MPTCNQHELGHDWQCRKRELPSETLKHDCGSLRSGENIYRQLCATRFESMVHCNKAYQSHDNVYRSCFWNAKEHICEEGQQTLACDCELAHKNCPHRQSGPLTGAQVAQGERHLSTGERFLVVLSVMLIVAGGAYAFR